MANVVQGATITFADGTKHWFCKPCAMHKVSDCFVFLIFVSKPCLVFFLISGPNGGTLSWRKTNARAPPAFRLLRLLVPRKSQILLSLLLLVRVLLLFWLQDPHQQRRRPPKTSVPVVTRKCAFTAARLAVLVRESHWLMAPPSGFARAVRSGLRWPAPSPRSTVATPERVVVVRRAKVLLIRLLQLRQPSQQQQRQIRTSRQIATSRSSTCRWVKCKVCRRCGMSQLMQQRSASRHVRRRPPCRHCRRVRWRPRTATRIKARR